MKKWALLIFLSLLDLKPKIKWNIKSKMSIKKLRTICIIIKSLKAPVFMGKPLMRLLKPFMKRIKGRKRIHKESQNYVKVWEKHWASRNIKLKNLKRLVYYMISVSYTHLRAHETRHDLVCRLLLEQKKNT